MNQRIQLAGLVLAVVLLAWVGGWALPLVILAIVLMVVGHEFGHFITAKLSGMEVTDFFVGFGPVLWSTTIGETRYGIRAFLLGGYVKVPGMTMSDTIVPEREARTYRSASYPRQVLFASAGSLMHVVMALLLAFSSLVFIGRANPARVEVAGLSQWSSVPTTPAQRAGIHVGDVLLAIDGVPVRTQAALIREIHDHVGVPLAIEVLRGAHHVTVRATPVDGRSIISGGAPLASGPRPVGYLGVALSEAVAPVSWSDAVPGAVSMIGSTVDGAVRGIIHVFSPGQFANLLHQVASPAAANAPQNQATRPQSIVGVVRIAVQSTNQGWGTFLAIMVSVNIFVGVLNLLPLLPLDGGYIAIATYERLRSRRGERYRADINLLAPVVYAFVAVLAVLFLSTLFLDIFHPLANPFR